MVAVVERPVEAEDTPIVERGLRAAVPPALASSAVLVTTATRLAMVLVLVLLWLCVGVQGGLRKEQQVKA